MTINLVQGTVIRVEDCPKGGQHVLTRARQNYCDVCRPPKSEDALMRQRRRRARLKESAQSAAPAVEAVASGSNAVQVDPLAAVQQALAEHVKVIERLVQEAEVKINARAVQGKLSRGLLARHADLVALQQHLETGVARAADLNQPPVLRGVGAPRRS